MKKVFGLVVLAGLIAGLGTAYAGPGCGAKKASGEAKAEGKSGCSDIFAKLNLTDEQKTKMAALKEDCDKIGCSVTSREKYMKGMKEILSAEQLEACKVECEKAGIKNCPIRHSVEAKSDSKS